LYLGDAARHKSAGFDFRERRYSIEAHADQRRASAKLIRAGPPQRCGEADVLDIESLTKWAITDSNSVNRFIALKRNGLQHSELLPLPLSPKLLAETGDHGILRTRRTVLKDGLDAGEVPLFGVAEIIFLFRVGDWQFGWSTRTE
jgi:hypothetical protein